MALEELAVSAVENSETSKDSTDADTMLIALRNLAGEVLEFSVSLSSTARDLKTLVAESSWSIPCDCQTLLTANNVLVEDDTSKLASHCEVDGDKYLAMTVLIHVQAIQLGLKSEISAVRKTALNSLAMLGWRYGPDAASTALPYLTDRAPQVRTAASRAIVSSIEMGDREVRMAIVKLLDKSSSGPPPDVRTIAMRTLPQIVDKGEHDLVAALEPFLHSSTSETRVAALKTLVAVSVKGDEYAIEKVFAFLEDQDASVRRTALQLLAKLHGRGHGVATHRAISMLEHPNYWTRKDALQSLESIAQLGDKQALRQTLSLLEHPEDDVRSCAVTALLLVAERGETLAVNAVVGLLRDCAVCVRLAAVDALPKLVSKDDLESLIELLEQLCLDDTSEDVRVAAMKAFGMFQATHIFEPGEMGITYDCNGLVKKTIPGSQAHAKGISEGDQIVNVGIENYSKDAVVTAEKSEATYEVTFKVSFGDKVVNALIARLHDPSKTLRIEAIAALVKIVKRGDRQVLAAVAWSLEDEDEFARSAAAEALVSLTTKGDEFTTGIVFQRVKDDRLCVKLVALHVLASIAERGIELVVVEVLRCLNDPDPFVRRAAACSLSKLAAIDDDRAISGLAVCLKDPRECVRIAAAESFPCLASVGNSQAIRALTAARELTGYGQFWISVSKALTAIVTG